MVFWEKKSVDLEVIATIFVTGQLFLDAGMGKKRRLLLVDVGAGPSRSQQRGEENLEAAYTTPHARADAPNAGTTPLGSLHECKRDFPLTVLEVGGGSSRSRDRVEEDLRATLAADQAIGDASDDDETQPPSPETSNVRAENLGQETPGSSNGTKKRGKTLMRKIWALPPDKKIELPLNAAFQPLGESEQTFIQLLRLSGTVLGYYLVRVLPSKTASSQVNPTFFATGSTPRHPGDYHHSTRIAFVEFTVCLTCRQGTLEASEIAIGS
ncbi:hypothetical protein CFP56_035180 [Quercus suber]|uniref:Uncharacterized protein n=1 Tax=Quercus suber TaxID=58331 RepID=A0AAW0LR42_QUESU